VVVADPPAAVTDTHPLLFHAAGGRHLGPRASVHFEACERREAILYVPAAVVWECSLLARAVRINLHRPVRAFFEDLFSNPAYQPLELTAEQIFVADEIRINRDPFDGLICAAALTVGLPLVTRDGDIRESKKIKVIW
jgi:PIN domain nuclease of toxin-antitoxin system